MRRKRRCRAQGIGSSSGSGSSTNPDHAGRPLISLVTLRQVHPPAERPRLHFAHQARRHQLLQPVPDPFAVPGNRRILTQDGDHLSASHRPARLGWDRQQLIREDPVRFRVRLCHHRLRRPGDQPGQYLPRDRQPLNLLPALFDQPRDPRGFLIQPQLLGPTRRFPLAQQPQDLTAIHPPTPTETQPTNPNQPGAGHHNRRTSTLISQVTQKETHPPERPVEAVCVISG